MARMNDTKFLVFIHRNRFTLLKIMFVITLLVFWPGILMHDSKQQCQQALAGIYSDHHPPIMAFVWHYASKIYAGSGLMFALQLFLLYLGVYFLLKVADKLQLAKPHLASVCLLILPLYPQILIYEVVILKDVHYAVCFLLSAALLSYYFIRDKRPSTLDVHLLLLLLIYGAGVKYIGQYTVIILAMWLGYSCAIGYQMWLRICAGIITYAVIFVSILVINSNLVSSSQHKFSWQYVKLYDLSAMSIQLNTDLIPKNNKTKAFSLTSLKKRFKYPAIDSLVFKDEPLLQVTTNLHDMEELQKIWYHELFAHPFIYLRHRLINFKSMIIARPGYNLEAPDVPLNLVTNSNSFSWVYHLMETITGVLFFLLMSHLPVILLGCVYFVLSLARWSQTRTAPILFAFSTTALIMVILVFFKSMAGTPRYTYMPVLMIHGSHIFAYCCLRAGKYGKL